MSCTKFHLITILFINITLICTIISFSTYWYKIDDQFQENNIIIYISATKEFYDYDYDSRFSLTRKWYEVDRRPDEKHLYGICLTLVIFSFISLTMASFISLLASTNIFSRCLKFPVNLAIRILNVVSFLFLLTGILALLHLPKSIDQDCRKYGPVYFTCGHAGSSTLIGRLDSESAVLTWSPYIGWSFAIIGAFFNLISIILTFYVSFQQDSSTSSTPSTSTNPKGNQYDQFDIPYKS